MPPSPQTPSSNWNLPGRPAWEVAWFYPPQGSWTEADYFELDGGPLVEFDGGCIEVLEMPSKEYQRSVQFLFVWLREYVLGTGIGEVFIAPLPIRLWTEKFREPDILFVREGRGEYQGYPEGADLVVEVVSRDEKSRRRDMETKRNEYACAKIAEYWIVDPQEELIKVLFFQDDQYQTFGEFGIGTQAHSQTLAGLSVPVSDVFASALPQR